MSVYTGCYYAGANERLRNKGYIAGLVGSLVWMLRRFRSTTKGVFVAVAKKFEDLTLQTSIPKFLEFLYVLGFRGY